MQLWHQVMVIGNAQDVDLRMMSESNNYETPNKYLDRKIKEITDLIEAGNHAQAIVTLEIKDTIMIHPQGNIPVVICSVTLNETLLKAWKDRK